MFVNDRADLNTFFFFLFIYFFICMEFRKMLMITLYAEQKKRHRFTEQSFRLCGRRQGQDVSREQHRNMYTIKGETDYRPRLDA